MDAGLVVSLTTPLLMLGLVFLGLAGTVRSGGLARDGAFGIRTAATLASDQAWNAGHRAAYGHMRGTGRLCVAAAGLAVVLVLTVPGQRGAAVAVGALGLGYVLFLATLTLTVRRANTAARGGTPPVGW